MNIADFLNIIKREGRYGTVNDNTDQAATDILNSINIRGKRIWSAHDWAWALEELSFALTVGSNGVYSVTSVSGSLVDRITDLYPVDTTVTPNTTGKPLRQVTRQDYYGWVGAGSQIPGDPTRYVNLGRNSAGLWQVLIAPPPATATTIKGWAKKILTTYVAADLTANTAFGYWPDGIIEGILKDGVLSDVERIQGNVPESARLDQSFEFKIKMLVDEQTNVGRDDGPLDNPVPDMYREKKRKRSKTGTGVY